MQIGELSRVTGTPVDTIRYYEKIGLLRPAARTQGNYRRYSSQAIDQLRFVRRCRRLGISLVQVRQLLEFCSDPERRCDEVNEMLDQHIERLDKQLLDMQSLARELRQLRAVCRAPGKAASCRILTSLQRR